MPPTLGTLSQKALELPKSLTSLRLSFGRHEVGEGFRGGQIDAAILEGATRELARLGMAQARQFCQHGKDGSNDRATAVHLQFANVFSGLAVRGREPERQALVEDIAACGVAHARKCRPAWGRKPAD